MPKGRPADPGGRSNKVRVVMMDADLSDAAISDLSTVLLNAFRPVHVRVADKKSLTAGNGASSAGQQQELPLDDEVESGDDADVQAEDVAAPTQPRSAPKRTYKQPESLDLDFEGGGTPFVEYAKKQTPGSDARRYLVATAWFKEYGNSPTVNINKIYTAYRLAKWPYGHIRDWDQVFRTLCGKAYGSMRRVKGAKGEYEITTVGLGSLQSPE